jgi:hypothetical protein
MWWTKYLHGRDFLEMKLYLSRLFVLYNEFGPLKLISKSSRYFLVCKVLDKRPRHPGREPKMDQHAEIIGGTLSAPSVLVPMVGVQPQAYDVPVDETLQEHCGRLCAYISTRTRVLVPFRSLYHAFEALVNWIVEPREANTEHGFQSSINTEASTLINEIDEHGWSLIDYFVKLCSEDDPAGLSREGSGILLEALLQKMLDNEAITQAPADAYPYKVDTITIAVDGALMGQIIRHEGRDF